MIYSMMGQPVTIIRLAVVADLQKPDKRDRAAIRAGSYVVVDYGGIGERVYHITYLKADGGSKEIADAIQKVKGENT